MRAACKVTGKLCPSRFDHHNTVIACSSGGVLRSKDFEEYRRPSARSVSYNITTLKRIELTHQRPSGQFALPHLDQQVGDIEAALPHAHHVNAQRLHRMWSPELSSDVMKMPYCSASEALHCANANVSSCTPAR